MKKIFTAQIVRLVSVTCALVFGALSFVAPISCKLTEEGVEVSNADTKSPQITDFALIDTKTIHLACSEKMTVEMITVSVIAADSADSATDIALLSEVDEEAVFATADSVTYSEDGKSADITLSKETQTGKAYVFSGVVYDETGNSLSFSQRFNGFNEQPARLIFNEVRATKSKTQASYIELYALTSGNVAGLEIAIAGTKSEATTYSIPAIRVKQGEYITIHCQILEKLRDGAKNELENNLALSTAKDSCDTARDLWIDSDENLFTNNSVFLLRDEASQKLYDALLLCPSKSNSWSSKVKPNFAEEAYNAGIWTTGCDIKDAVQADYATALARTVSRQNTAELAAKYNDDTDIPDVIPTSADDWIVASEATPGYENNRIAYSK